MDDRGNWTETLGVVSLVVEGALLVARRTTQFIRSRAVLRRRLLQPGVMPTQRFEEQPGDTVSV